MENNIDNQIEILTNDKSIERIVKKFKEMDSYGLTVHEIYEYIKEDSVYFGKCLYLVAINNGYKDLAEKIKSAIKILNDERITNFIYSINEGNVEHFLGSLSFDEKLSILSNIDAYADFDVLCPGGREIIKILEDSISCDLIGIETNQNIYNRKIKKEKTPLVGVLHRSRKNGKFYKFN